MRRLFRLILLVAGLVFIGFSACSPLSPIASTLEPLKTQAAGFFSTPTDIATQEYVLQPGDTPKGVALMFGTTVETLITLNAERYPEMGQTPMKFNAGWSILVPKKTGSVIAPTIASGGSDSEVVQSSTTVVIESPIASNNGNEGAFDYDGALEIIRLTNEERAKAGVPPLTIDEGLMELARKRATEIVNDWSHQGLDDDCPDCGENLVKGGDVAGEFQWWMNSEGHRGGILWPDYLYIGAARYIVNGKAYAVQLFK